MPTPSRFAVAAIAVLASLTNQSRDSRAAEREAAPEQRRIRVLYLEEQPRWQYRYMCTAFGDPGSKIDLDACVFTMDSGDPDSQRAKLPTSREELSRYDVVLIGDVPKRRLGADDEAIDRWLRMLSLFAKTGGGVGFLSGTRAMPRDYLGTRVEELFPVRFEQRALWTKDRGRATPVSVGQQHPITRVASKLERSFRTWEQLTPMQLGFVNSKLSDDSTEVLTAADDDATLILAAAGKRRRGHVFFIATDETWRWRSSGGIQAFNSFWRNVVTYLASGRTRRRDEQRK